VSSTEKLAAMKAAHSMGVPMSQIAEDMADKPEKSPSFKHRVKTDIVRMLEYTFDNKPYRSAWDIADEAMQIVFDAYMIDKTHEFLNDAYEELSDYSDADHNGASFVPNQAMTLTITAETILRQIECPMQKAADKMRSAQ